MVSKGRQAFGDRHGSHIQPETVQRGEDNGNSKLTPEIVLEIRRLYLIEKVKSLVIANKFNISQVTVTNIAHRRSWQHV